MTREELARDLYEVYRHHLMRHGVVRGHWHQLSDAERSAWEKVAHEVGRRSGEDLAAALAGATGG